MVNYFLNSGVIDHLDYRTNRAKHYPLNEDQLRLATQNIHILVNYIDDEDYLITNNLQSPIVVDGPEVLYKINRDGFRSKHFEDFNPENINILYGGCSWTFGEGLPEEYTWTHLLSEKIKTLHPDTQVDSYNIGYMGAGIDLILKNTMAFVESVGKPDYIFLNFPDPFRRVRYNDLTQYTGDDPMSVPETYVKAFRGDYFLRFKKNHPSRKWSIESTHANVSLDNSMYIHMMEAFAAAAGINLIWTSWVYDHEMMNINFKNSFWPEINGPFSRSSRDSQDVPFENTNDLPYWSIAKDDAHPGTAYTTWIAQKFYERVLSSSHF